MKIILIVASEGEIKDIGKVIQNILENDNSSELNIKPNIVSTNVYTQKLDNEDILMNCYELGKYLPDRPARQTIYGWVNNRLIPFEKHGRRLFFKKSKIDEWLKNKRIPIKYFINEDEKLTRPQVCKFLSVSRQMSYNYQKKNLLTPLKIGKRTYFKANEAIRLKQALT